MGREVVEKLTGKTVLDSMDGFFTRYGKHTILVCRLLPFVPFDPISYAAGLTSIRFRSFFIATGLGQLPATIVYSWAGSMLTGGTFWFVTGLFILPLSKIPLILRPQAWLHRRHYGEVLSPIRWWGRIPFIFYLVSMFVGWLERKRSPLDPVVRSLVSARIAQMCLCEFCVDITSMKVAERTGSR